MLNQVVIVGRIAQDLEIKDTENGKVTNVTLAVPRSFKNAEGSYDTDFIDCTLWKNIAESTVEYCKKGDLVGVKGRLQMNNYKDKDGNNKSKLNVIAEKVTFLSTKAKENVEREVTR